MEAVGLGLFARLANQVMSKADFVVIIAEPPTTVREQSAIVDFVSAGKSDHLV